MVRLQYLRVSCQSTYFLVENLDSALTLDAASAQREEGTPVDDTILQRIVSLEL